MVDLSVENDKNIILKYKLFQITENKSQETNFLYFIVIIINTSFSSPLLGIGSWLKLPFKESLGYML